MAKQVRQFEHEDVAAVPLGYKVKTVQHPSGHKVRIAYPPGRRRTGAGTLVSILHPKGEKNPCGFDPKPAIQNPKLKTREQIEAMQDKAVRFLRDVVGNDAKADEIDALSVAEYAERKKITLANPAKPQGKKRNPRGKRRKKNQSAEALFKTFHGKTPKETLELHEAAAMRGEFTSLGELIELVVESPGGEDLRLGFDGEKVKLACAPTGTQLYLIGGNQVLNGSLKRFGADTAKDFVELGTAQSIVYRAAKDFTDFKSADYEHEFGEESGDKPHVFYDKFKQRIFLMGGRYRVERPGIID
jgi:hypothetical protein